MCDLWNDFELKKPPQITLNVPIKNAPNVQRLQTAIYQYFRRYRPQETEFAEASALLGRLMARRKSSFRGMIGFRAVVKCNTATCRLLRIDIIRQLELFQGSLPDFALSSANTLELPTRNSFDYVLVRLLNVHGIYQRIRECCKQAAEYFAKMMRNNFFMETSTLLLAVLSKLHNLSALLDSKCVDLYNQMQPMRTKFPLAENSAYHNFELPDKIERILDNQQVEVCKTDESLTVVNDEATIKQAPKSLTAVHSKRMLKKIDLGIEFMIVLLFDILPFFLCINIMVFEKEKLKLKELGQWPDTKYKRLFEFYKARPFLWNKNAPNYMNHMKKQQALDEIGSELGCCGEEAKLRFRSMRQTYGQNVKKMAKNGGAGNAETQWRFTKHLTFLSVKSTRCDCESVNNMPDKQMEKVIGADDVETKWHNATNFSFVSSETTQSESTDTINQDCFNDEKLMDFQPNNEVSESSCSQPSCKKYLAVSAQECLDERGYPEKQQATDLATTNKNSGVYESFANTVSKQLEGFPEDVSYQLMADIQTLLSQRKVALIRETQSTNSQTCGISKHNESTVANSFIKQETETLNEY